MPDTDTEPAPLWRRLAWFFAIAAASAAAVAAVAYGLRALLLF
jgi:anti-sigma-K factor RskA